MRSVGVARTRPGGCAVDTYSRITKAQIKVAAGSEPCLAIELLRVFGKRVNLLLLVTAIVGIMLEGQ